MVNARLTPVDGAPQELPAGAPFVARWLAAVLPALSLGARAEVRRGHVGAAQVREALTVAIDAGPPSVRPTRSELRGAMAWLQEHAPEALGRVA